MVRAWDKGKVLTNELFDSVAVLPHSGMSLLDDKLERKERLPCSLAFVAIRLLMTGVQQRLISSMRFDRRLVQQYRVAGVVDSIDASDSSTVARTGTNYYVADMTTADTRTGATNAAKISTATRDDATAAAADKSMGRRNFLKCVLTASKLMTGCVPCVDVRR